MSDHTYKIVELIGSSPDGVEKAIENAIGRASQTLKGLDWFEVREIRGQIHDGKVGWYQVKLGVGFRVMDAADLASE
jgi:flavin-binding protein dodecin